MRSIKDIKSGDSFNDISDMHFYKQVTQIMSKKGIREYDYLTYELKERGVKKTQILEHLCLFVMSDDAIYQKLLDF